MKTSVGGGESGVLGRRILGFRVFGIFVSLGFGLLCLWVFGFGFQTSRLWR